MSRVIELVVVALAITACDDSKVAKVKQLTKKGDDVLEKFDFDEAKQHVANAKQALAAGTDPAEDCSWVARISGGDGPEATKAQVVELRRLCTIEVPLGRATRAVTAAEKAKVEQPEAPSYTECSSDEWAAAKQALDGSPASSDARWTGLKARWTKICGS